MCIFWKVILCEEVLRSVEQFSRVHKITGYRGKVIPPVHKIEQLRCMTRIASKFITAHQAEAALALRRKKVVDLCCQRLLITEHRYTNYLLVRQRSGHQPGQRSACASGGEYMRV